MADGGQIPVILAAFNTFVNRIIPFLADAANQDRLGVSDDNRDDMTAQLGDSTASGTWISLWALTSSDTTATKPLRATRDVLMKEMTTLIRSVYDDIIESELTNDDRTTLLIPKRDTKPTDRPKITIRPTLKLIVMGGASFTIENRVDKDQTRPSMNPEADYVEMAYIIGTTPPASVSETNKVKVLSKAREVISFDPANAGKTLYCYTRYVNKTDDSKSGPFTRLHSAVISD